MRKNDAQHRRDQLRRFMESRNLKVAEWSRRAGINKNILYNFFNKRSESLSQDTLEKLARAEGVSVDNLFNLSRRALRRPVQAIIVLGHVQAGDWREAVMWGADDQYPIEIPLLSEARAGVYALETRGRSMDREYPDGTLVVCVNIYDYAEELASEDHVVVYRKRQDGLIEATLKELIIDEEGRFWLWPRSSDPQHQQPIRVPGLMPGEQPGFDGVASIEIAAVVIGSYRPRRKKT